MLIRRRHAGATRLATATALIAEAARLALRGKPATLYLTDLSAVVTAWLIALTFSRRSPLVAHRGGDAHRDRDRQAPLRRPGAEPFNPAMVAFCTMIVAFPALMSQWPGRDSSTSTPSSLISSWAVPAARRHHRRHPLDACAPDFAGWRQRHRPGSWRARPSAFSAGPAGNGSPSPISSAACSSSQRIITWHMPAAFLLALAACDAVLVGHAARPLRLRRCSISPVAGACWPPSSSSPTRSRAPPRPGQAHLRRRHRLPAFVIRSFGAYPDGIAFAVLLLNICVPLIDMKTQPPVFGHKREGAAMSAELFRRPHRTAKRRHDDDLRAGVHRRDGHDPPAQPSRSSPPRSKPKR